MKISKRWGLSLIVLCALGAAFFLYWPRQVHLDVQGVKYHLGEANAGHEELVRVKIDSEVWKDWKGARTFSGTIDIQGSDIPLTESEQKIKINLGEGAGSRLIAYNGYHEITGPFRYIYGSFYADDPLRNVTINVFEQKEDGGSEWSSDSGLMVSAPASNRTEALEVANKLMKKDMRGEALK
ncbi:hypothetical protein GCM10007362_07780 [Saccharibacillus endophyticus]|uniref:SRPBCC family protein n=2 Tax=Saccharibacillus endophyticus TaxID=2060666 RepID=A0ABQ1ZQE3_9BACL|nr:hypothetical protein GCM10007362_07780 [Saccharibacillus endophyticus]